MNELALVLDDNIDLDGYHYNEDIIVKEYLIREVIKNRKIKFFDCLFNDDLDSFFELIYDDFEIKINDGTVVVNLGNPNAISDFTRGIGHEDKLIILKDGEAVTSADTPLVDIDKTIEALYIEDDRPMFEYIINNGIIPKTISKKKLKGLLSASDTIHLVLYHT